VVRNSINIFGQLDEPSIKHALTLLESYGLDAEPFLQTVEQFKQ